MTIRVRGSCDCCPLIDGCGCIACPSGWYTQYEVVATNTSTENCCEELEGTFILTYAGDCCWLPPANDCLENGTYPWVLTVNSASPGVAALSYWATCEVSVNGIHIFAFPWDCQTGDAAAINNGYCGNAGQIQFTISPVEASFVDCIDPGFMEASGRSSVITKASTSGPGTELEAMFKSIHLTGKTGCGCRTLASQMDRWGPEGCRVRTDEIVTRLRTNWAKLKWTDKARATAMAIGSGLAFKIDPRDPAPGLLDEAIRRAEEKAK